MGKQLSRREFVGAAVTTAGAVLSGSHLQLVRQAAQALKAKAERAGVHQQGRAQGKRAAQPA